MPQSAVIVIGNEILAGHTVEANMPFLAKELAHLGLPLGEALVVPDIQDAIVAAVNALRAKFQYVFTTGGIGPTHDDITADAIAVAFGVACEENPLALRRLEDYYRGQNIELNAARRRMARMPAGAKLIENPVSSAPGFFIENVYVMAGVPNIMQAMFKGIAPGLIGGPPILMRSIVSQLLEGNIAKDLTEIQARFSAVDIGSYPSFRGGQYQLKLILRTADASALAECSAAVIAMCAQHGAAEPEIQDWQ